MINTEENAKTLIDKMLTEQGWDLINDVEKEITIDSETLERADYILKGENKEYIAVIEAKKRKKNYDLHSALDQGKNYAKKMDIKYVFASDGKDIWFLDLFKGIRKKLDRFYTKQELIDMLNTQDPMRNVYQGLPKNLRYYQREAIFRILEAIDNGRKKMFLEMATGTGKTFTASSLIEELIQTGRSKRVLFMVDRGNLAEQTVDAFKKAFKGRIATDLLVGNAKDKTNRVLVSTVQQLYVSGWNKEAKKFEPLYNEDFFDLIILDECHRSYFGQWHCILEYFQNAVKLGLTATPALLRDRNTYQYFGQPIYRYTYKQGVSDGYLAPCEIDIIRTNVDMYGLTYNGEDFKPNELEVKVNVPRRNELIVEEYRKRFPVPPKTLVFAVSKRHATELANLFRKEYGEDAVAVIVSGENTRMTSDLISKFKDPNSKLKIACTVEMLSTGFDAPSIEVLVMARPTKSSILYYQMKGRGSRLYEDEKTGYKKTHFTILDFVDNVEHEYEQNIITAEMLEKYENEWESENEKDRESGSRYVAGKETIEDIENKQEKIVIADGIEVWVEQEEFLKENEQKLKEIFDSIGEQISNQYDTKIVIEKFKQAVNSWLYFTKNTSVTQEYLNETGINITEVREAFNLPKADIKTLVNLVLGKDKVLTLKQKKEKAFKKWLDKQWYNEKQKKFLLVCFELVSDYSIDTINDLLQKGVVNAFGGTMNVIRLFGNADNLKEVFEKVKNFNDFLDYIEE